ARGARRREGGRACQPPEREADRRARSPVRGCAARRRAMTQPFEPGARAARAFGRAMQALHLRMGGDAAQAASVGRWAALAWGQADAGHVCVDVPDESERAALGASPVVGPSGEPLPLVLDRGALYLQRLWRAETTLAHAVRTLDTEVPFACGGG